MNFKIGDRVKINKEKLYHQDFFKGAFQIWYSYDIYTILEIIDNIATLNSNIPNNISNRIHCAYLKSLKEERKNKLLKIKLL